MPAPLSLTTGQVYPVGPITSAAGTGTQNFRPGGILYWERPNLSTASGSTVFVASTGYILPANSLVTNGDRIILEANMLLGTAATDNKNLRANIGYSAFTAATGVWTGGTTVMAESSASNTGATSWHARAYLTRLGATSMSYHWLSLWEGADISQGVAYTTTSSNVDFTTAMNIQFAVGNTTGSNTQILTLNEVRVIFEPYM